MICDDTIAAISSAVGPAARIIVRISGGAARGIGQTFGISSDLTAGSVRRCNLRFADLSLPAAIYFFQSPRSYTAEDLVEFHIPGNPVLARMLLDALVRAGARLAEAGEFTARAYFNGRMDLTAAEGVAATIAATGERELAAARQLMAGELARRLAPVMDLIADTLALLEVGIDFVEEDVTFLSAEQVRERVTRADAMLGRLLAESSRFERLSHEPRVVLVGRPNAGKSTLLNALAGRERAVVSPVAGTTRDVLSAEVILHRGTIHLIDVAGLHEPNAIALTSEIDDKMRSHALREVQGAEVVVLVEDATDERPRVVTQRDPAFIVRSKADLLPSIGVNLPSRGTPVEGQGKGSPREQHRRAVNPHPSTLPDYRQRGNVAVLVSAFTGEGIDVLREHLDAICFGDRSMGSTLALNLRHVRAIEEARTALRRTLDQLPANRPELLALELREALDALGSILGRVTPDDLLGRIFAGFCIGK